ncbi:reverse transcriptase domain-containing protein, partial [Tanacetum coccineum]
SAAGIKVNAAIYNCRKITTVRRVHTAQICRIFLDGYSVLDVRIEAYGSEEVPESSKARDISVVSDLVPEPETWKLYTDGDSNDYGSGIGLILIDLEEYEALLGGLRIATELKVKNVHAFVDSKLMASKVGGSYEAREDERKIGRG